MFAQHFPRPSNGRASSLAKIGPLGFTPRITPATFRAETQSVDFVVLLDVRPCWFQTVTTQVCATRIDTVVKRAAEKAHHLLSHLNPAGDELGNVIDITDLTSVTVVGLMVVNGTRRRRRMQEDLGTTPDLHTSVVENPALPQPCLPEDAQKPVTGRMMAGSRAHCIKRGQRAVSTVCCPSKDLILQFPHYRRSRSKKIRCRR